MYNVLEELRSDEPLSAASQPIHDRGLVSVLRELHDELDQAVAEAYGWPAEISTEDILFRLVELNAVHAAEERSGLIRWIRPEFQKSAETQTGLGVEMEEEDSAPHQDPCLLRNASVPLTPGRADKYVTASDTSSIPALTEISTVHSTTPIPKN